MKRTKINKKEARFGTLTKIVNDIGSRIGGTMNRIKIGFLTSSRPTFLVETEDSFGGGHVMREN